MINRARRFSLRAGLPARGEVVRKTTQAAASVTRTKLVPAANRLRAALQLQRDASTSSPARVAPMTPATAGELMELHHHQHQWRRL